MSGENRPEAAGPPTADSPAVGTDPRGTGAANARPAGADRAGPGPAGANLAAAGPAGADRAGTELAGTELAGTALAGTELAGTELAGTELAGTEPGVAPAANGPRAGRRRWRADPLTRVLAGAGVLLALVAGAVGAHAAAGASSDDPPSSQPVKASAASPDAVATRNPAGPSWGPVTAPQSPVAPPAGPPAAAVRPLSVSIPAIGVGSSLIPLELISGSGQLEAPADFGQAGWYAAGPTPGERGPAVIAGHVDSRRGPAIFFRLRELRTGDVIAVERSDGVTARFAVTGVERYPKAAFPTQRVHGPTPDRALRLITCGGAFDHAKRSYRDNVVVYAVRL